MSEKTKHENRNKLAQAIKFLNSGNIASASNLALSVIDTDPKNENAWVILGGCALKMIDGQNAESFFLQALQQNEHNPAALSGLGKAKMLQVKPHEAVEYFKAAIENGSTEKEMVLSLSVLMEKMNQRRTLLPFLEKVANKTLDKDLLLKTASVAVDESIYKMAITYFDKAFKNHPQNKEAQLGNIKSLYYQRKYRQSIESSEKYIKRYGQETNVLIDMAAAMRQMGQNDKALETLEKIDFESDVNLKAHALSLKGNIYQDFDDLEKAEEHYRHAMFLSPKFISAQDALSVMLLASGSSKEGWSLWKQRKIARFPNLQTQEWQGESLSPGSKLIILKEQGIGDQLLFGCTINAVKEKYPDINCIFATEPRLSAIFKRSLDINTVDESNDFSIEISHNDRHVYLGDIPRLLNMSPQPTKILNPYIRTDKGKTLSLQKRYDEMFGDKKKIGVSWRSNNVFSGNMRSVSLKQLLAIIPDDYQLISLQYGVNTADFDDLPMAQRKRIFMDSSVNQESDVDLFLSQVSLMDRVITIDNTTAHVAGSMGHPNTDVLLPKGTECMWYWGKSDTIDPWYNTLRLHRQSQRGIWDDALKGIHF